MQKFKIPEIQFPETMPTLINKRVEMRPIIEKDLESLFEIYSTHKVMKAFVSIPHQDRSQTKGLINYLQTGFKERRAMIWGIYLKGQSDQLIADGGFCRFQPARMRGELAGKILSTHQSQGLMQEAVEVTHQYGFQVMGLNSMELAINPENRLSINLANACGYEQEGLLKEYIYCPFQKKYIDAIIFSLRYQTWKKIRQPWPLEDFIRN